MRRALLAVSLLLAGPAAALYAEPTYLDPIYGFATTTNIVYGTGAINNGSGTLNLLLDLYRPTDIGQGALPAASPAIVLIHGGGFTGGNKNDVAGLAQVYATYGYTVASISYRLLGHNVPETHGPADAFTQEPPPPYATLPDPQGRYTVNAAVNDASAAMAWMRTNAATYNVDASKIAIGGVSAGAITALLQAYNNPAPASAPQAVLSFLGAMYGTENSIQAGAAPAFLVAGMVDNVVPFGPPLGIVPVVDRMNQVGVYNEFYAQPGVGHDVNFGLMFGNQTLFEHNIEFLATVLVPEPATWLLLALALPALLAIARRRVRNR